MRGCAARAILSCMVALASLPAAAQSRPPAPPVEAFFGRQGLVGASLSPDGRRVLLKLEAPAQRPMLAVLDTATMTSRPVAMFSDIGVGGFGWVDDARLVHDFAPRLVGPQRIEQGVGLEALDADGGRNRVLVRASWAWAKAPEPDAVKPLDFGARRLVDQPTPPDGSVDLMLPREIGRDRIGHFELHRVDTVSGRSREIDLPPGTQQVALDPAGRPRMVATLEGRRQRLLLREKADGPWRTVTDFDRLDPATDAVRHPWLVDADDRFHVMAPHQGRAALFRMQPDGGLEQPPLAASDTFDLQPRPIVRQGRLIGWRHVIDAEVTHWLDTHARSLQQRLDRLLTSGVNRLTLPERGDSPWALVESWSDVQPTVTRLWNTRTDQLTVLGSARPDLDPRSLGIQDFVKLPVRDGQTMPAWLTLPSDGRGAASPGPHPLVVLVHGGPWSRGGAWGFDAEVQFLASRGYAVLQPEFRGSTGYGSAWFRAGWREWGRRMNDDLVDAARWAVTQGHAQAGRICVAGASYGGYATLMALARSPETFRCGVAWAAVTDLELLRSAHWSDVDAFGRGAGYNLMIGDPVADAERLREASPLAHAARLTQPLLLAAGAWDVRVPVEHGQRLRDAVAPHNPTLEWVRYETEAHGWVDPSTRIDFWRRVEGFLGRHLPVGERAPTPPAAASR